jgi:hypothetical protein
MKKFAIVLLIVCVYALHQDFFNWKEYKPLLFGFLPIGLWYHGAYALLCSAMFFILGRTVWPKHLEEVETHAGAHDNRGGH